MNQKEDDQNNNRQSPNKWEKIEILSRPIAATLTAIAVALLGFWGQKAIKEMSDATQKRIRDVAAQEQDNRLYTELLSRREQSESLLRKDMISGILEDFFEESMSPTTTPQNAHKTISKKLLKLEMLALNFGDSLSLGPLFLEIKRDIERSKPSANEKAIWDAEKAKYKKRLHRLAKRVAGAQLSAIKPHGVSRIIDIPLSRTGLDVENLEKMYRWPSDKFTLETYDQEVKNKLCEDEQRFELNGFTWVLSITFSQACLKNKTIHVDLDIHEWLQTNQDESLGQLSQSPVHREFDLNFFNFPLIDNTRLPSNQRFALVMTGFDKERITFEGVIFPAEYSSQRDKPYLTEVVETLRKQEKQEHE